MEKTGYQKLRIYELSEELSDLVWITVMEWNHLAQETVGKQLIRAADSIGANIAEGAGRGSKVENRRFVRIARGSLFEVKHWLQRAYKRNLLTDEQVDRFKELIDELTPKISAYINSLG